jgi:hypothetical protein
MATFHKMKDESGTEIVRCFDQGHAASSPAKNSGSDRAAAAHIVTSRVAPQHGRTGKPGWIALRDRPYLVATALSGVMSLQYEVLTVALPLWILDHTSCQQWVVSPLLILNTVLVVFFQVRASRGVDGVESGATVTRRAGWVFALSCSMFAVTAVTRSWVTPLLLVIGVAVHTIGGDVASRRAVRIRLHASVTTCAGPVPGRVQPRYWRLHRPRAVDPDHPVHCLGMAGLVGAWPDAPAQRRANHPRGTLGRTDKEHGGLTWAEYALAWPCINRSEH